MEPLTARLSKIKMLVLDVDGILTDARVFLGPDGEWRRFFSIRDGIGIRLLLEGGYQVALITGSKAEDIRLRAKHLGIPHLYEGNMDKEPAIADLLQKTSLKAEEYAYMGDDFFDVPLLEKAGFAATVSDAMNEAKDACQYVAQRPAGNGAVREVCDLIYRYGAFAKRGKG